MRHSAASAFCAVVVAFLACITTTTVRAATVQPTYFLVAERPELVRHHDSFVLPLTDASHIAHARDLIARGAEGAGEPIIFASIDAAADHLNRNLTAVGQPNWSWHVTGVEGFADTGIEQLDSWPTFVEQNRDLWMTETGGKIGFWSYTVVAELKDYPATLPAVPVPLPSALPAALVCVALAAPTVLVVRRRRGLRIPA